MLNELISISHQDIATAAYLLWEQRGRPEGCELDIWFQAENRLLQQLRDLQKQDTFSINHSTTSDDSFPMEINVKSKRMGLLNSSSSIRQPGDTKKKKNPTRQRN